MPGARQCDGCGAPLDENQRYCLICGSRAGARSAQLDELLRRVRERRTTRDRYAVTAPVVEDGRAPGSSLRVPGPRMSAVLVAVFVAFGVLLGAAAHESSDRLVAATGGPLKLVVPHRKAGVEATRHAEGEASEQGSTEPPESEAEATPAASPTKTTRSQGTQSASHESEPREAPKPVAPKLSEIGHVFVIVLSDEPYAATFGPESSDRYVVNGLEPKGALLVRYDAIAHEQLPNGIALLSGQGPTAATAADCPTYAPFSPTGIGPDAQLLGEGCVYPATVETLPGQLTAHHLSWRAYVEGIDESGAAAPACAHPASGASDPTAASGSYATYRNPAMYFESITSAAASCAGEDVGMSKLAADLVGPASGTPRFSYLVPDRCHDGAPVACAPGAPSGPSDAEPVLSRVVPEIMRSKAFRKDGLIVITSDEAPSSGEFADSSECCGQPSYPNYTAPEVGHGGGAVGALLISPFIKGGTTSQEPYNHYSLLRTIEDVFELHHLGYAGLPEVKSLSTGLLTLKPKG